MVLRHATKTRRKIRLLAVSGRVAQPAGQIAHRRIHRTVYAAEPHVDYVDPRHLGVVEREYLPRLFVSLWRDGRVDGQRLLLTERPLGHAEVRRT